MLTNPLCLGRGCESSISSWRWRRGTRLSLSCPCWARPRAERVVLLYCSHASFGQDKVRLLDIRLADAKKASPADDDGKRANEPVAIGKVPGMQELHFL